MTVPFPPPPSLHFGGADPGSAAKGGASDGPRRTELWGQPAAVSHQHGLTGAHKSQEEETQELESSFQVSDA